MRRAAVLVLAAVLLAACVSDASSEPDDEARARATINHFYDRYVTDDGRVVRHDQGGDTASEGQAYALLLAAAAGDGARFDRVWRWTATHLQRPDGLLSWHWADGAIVDSQPASDADLDTARALLLAADRFSVPAYRAEALRIGAGVLAAETIDVVGRPVLVPGPWAHAVPIVLNPSYISPRAYRALAGVTGDPRWTALRETGVAQLAVLTADSLPPDWAVVDPATDPIAGVRPAPAPGSTEGPGYRFDAPRVPLRFSEDCGDDARAIAAGLWPLLRDRDADHPVELAAAAAAASAAGATARRDELLDDAERRDDEHPTYYGAAWVALARVMLTTDLLGTCS